MLENDVTSLFFLKVLEFFHFACTCEDINNLAHALMLKGAMNNVILPVVDDLIQTLCNMAKDNAHISMVSRTHGQVKSCFLHALNFFHTFYFRKTFSNFYCLCTSSSSFWKIVN